MATMKAVRIHTYGGPEVLRYEDVARPVPAAGEVLIKIQGLLQIVWLILPVFRSAEACR
jgi:hypothetical protein